MAESPTSILRRFYEGVNAGAHVSVIDETIADDLIEHEKFPGVEPSKEGVKEVFSAFRSVFPDFHIDVHQDPRRR
jgi:SnoaL-like polyketide cyclase